MSKHAYLIVANSNFKVLRTCLRMIDDRRNDIYLLLDKKSLVTKEFVDCLRSEVKESTLNVINSISVNWGGYSQINAVIHLLKDSLASNKEYSYLHFFQGSDLPIKTQNHIHNFFDNANDMQFISVEKNRNKMAQNKCWYYHFFCHNRYFRTSKFMKILNFSTVHLQKILHIRHNTDIELYQGSALFSITKSFAEFIVGHESEIKRRYRWSLAADECFIQSLAMNSAYKSLISGIDGQTSCNARLIDRSRPDGRNSPHVWRIEELDYIIKQPAEMCFARKFDERIDFDIVSEIEQNIKYNGK